MIGDKTLQDDVLAYFKEEAEVIGGLALQYHNKLQPHQIRTKSCPTDLVTIADLEISKRVVATVQQTFGDRVALLTEETSKDFVHDAHNHQPIMLVDELDGTRSFAKGGEFCHLFALAESLYGTYLVTVGLVYNPLQREWYFATIDSDAVVLRKGVTERIRVSRQETIEPSSSKIHVRLSLSQRKEYVAMYAATMRAIGNVSEAYKEQERFYRGSFGMEAMDVAEGKVEAVMYQRVANWDCAAPSLIIQQAGGRRYLLKTQEHIAKQTPWSLQLVDPAAYYPVMLTNGSIDKNLFEELRK